MNNFVYKYKNALYLNLTNRCTNDCVFCIRRGHDGVGGNGLWLSREPSAGEVVDIIKGEKGYAEYVFCGYGEPTVRLDTVLEINEYLKAAGKKTRINTNGHSDLIWGRDTAPDLAQIDHIGISLNAASADEYVRRCNPCYGKQAFDSLIALAGRLCRLGKDTTLSVVNSVSAEEIDRCRAIALELGAGLRVREFE